MAILVDRPIEVGPRPRATTGCFINAPRGANGTSMRTRRLLVSGQEALDPALHGAPIDDKAALRKPRDHVGIAEPGAHGVADGSGEHVVGKAWCVKAVVERAVKRCWQSLHRQRRPPSGVCPSFRVRSLVHRMHGTTNPSHVM